MRHSSLLAFIVCMAAGISAIGQEETVGVRPYEMDWAGRTKDDWPALVDFENLDGWTVETENAIAKFERTREQQLFGKYVGKLTYRYDGKGLPKVIIRPPQPIPVPADYDMIGCWMYGNNWAWVTDVSTPRVGVHILFGVPGQEKEEAVFLKTVDWKEWFLPLRRLTNDQIARLVKPGVTFNGIQITNGKNKADRTLYFDSLTMHKEEFKPLTFKPRPLRGIDMFEGQGTGANNGPGRLPFPTREDTILPDSAAPGSVNNAKQDGNAFELTYAGSDGNLVMRYEPKSGRWDDIQMKWNDGAWFQPLFGGGAQFFAWNRGQAPEKAELLKAELVGKSIVTTWKYSLGEKNFDATYTMQMKGKTLILDTKSLGGKLGAVAYGGAKGLENPRAFLIPYYDYAAGRPGAVVSGTADKPLFYTAHTDWYRSNASTPWGDSRVADGIAYANGGVKYIPKTDGTTNDCFERFFVTVSPKFEETLPNIPNPKSPWKHIAGTHQWRAHGAGNRERDKAYWYNIWRHGMRKCLITDHEVCWRDGGESFTFRTKAAPKKGGDAGMYDYARYMQDTLGFVYGPYNNFTDFAPVNEYWSTDMIARQADNQLQPAWARCYGPKPQYAIEYCAELSPINQKKFHFSTAYCDVHTSVTPWGRCDYDYRVPGAGTFAATFYAYGEIMLHQKAAWNGPVYSEGPHFCFYSGLTDGNYAQDRSYYLPTDPWLVDFDLRKIHDQECNFGMGNHEMFFKRQWKTVGEEGTDAAVDRFLAATAAFGHPGFLVNMGHIRRTMRGYFMLQQLHSRYTQVSADTIGYVDADGKIYDTSAALANGVYKRSQVVVRYQDGTCVAANGSVKEWMKTTFNGRDVNLPPQGYAGWTEDGKIDVISAEHAGSRCDYAVTPDYIYIDGRDKAFQRFPLAAASGAGVLRKIDDNSCEFIPVNGSECGWGVVFGNAIVEATALDKEMKEIGKAELRHARGLTYVLPVEGAFSYKLMLGKVKRLPDLTSDVSLVAAGETVVVTDYKGEKHTVKIPDDAKKGQRFWFEINKQWIDFTVDELVSVDFNMVDNDVEFTFKAKRSDVKELTATFEGQTKTLALDGNGHAIVLFTLPPMTETEMRTSEMVIASGPAKQSVVFGMNILYKPIAYPFNWEKANGKGICFRKGKEQESMADTGAGANYRADLDCGDVQKAGWFMHPPYRGGVGYTFVKYNLTVPKDGDMVFRAAVGKQDGSDLGDGIWYYIYVKGADGKETKVGEQIVKEHVWKPIEANLAPWKGQEVQLKLVADVGPADNSTGDWSCWGDLRLESKDVRFVRSLDNVGAQYIFEEPKDYVKGLTTADLRKAKRGWFCYDGQGFNSTPGSYESYGVLNGVNFGLLQQSNGDETKGTWGEEVRNELTDKALKALVKYNRFELLNTGEDYFKLHRFRIVLELEDGRMVSSKIMSSAVTQPGDWAHAEGILFTMSSILTVPIEF
ncbi:MAG: hypothetical protein K6G44_11660 [Lentisphaeria bacterium]|nr:hypothetical protein [Lentisphaeria bacterium]